MSRPRRWRTSFAKEVPGIEIFLAASRSVNRSVGGLNPAAIERMVLVKGGWGKVIWFPTFDSENQVRYSKQDRPYVSVARNGRLLPEALEVIALAAKYHLMLETGHSSPEEGLMILREARRAGVPHRVVTHAMLAPVPACLWGRCEKPRPSELILNSSIMG